MSKFCSSALEDIKISMKKKNNKLETNIQSPFKWKTSLKAHWPLFIELQVMFHKPVRKENRFTFIFLSHFKWQSKMVLGLITRNRTLIRNSQNTRNIGFTVANHSSLRYRDEELYQVTYFSRSQDFAKKLNIDFQGMVVRLAWRTDAT